MEMPLSYYLSQKLHFCESLEAFFDKNLPGRFFDRFWERCSGMRPCRIHSLIVVTRK